MRLGVLDVGSNTVHLQVMDAHHGSAPLAFQSFKEEIRLAEFLTDKGELSITGIDTLLRTLTRLKNEAKDIQLDDMLAFATSAIREATNSDEVLAAVNRETGIDLQVLSGADEARFTFLAVRRWVGWSAGDVVLLDIGGGSLEVATGEQENPRYCNSVMLGANRMTRQFLTGDPFTEKSLNKLREHVQSTLAPLKSEIGDNSKRTAIGTSKTFRTLRRIQQNYLPDLGNSLTRDGLKTIVPRLAKMTQTQRAGLPGVSASRAVQIVAGAIVAEEAMSAFGIEKLTQCPWALREGIVLQRLDWLKS
ncbi:MAG: Ppx/GppA family phosphatase [Candidatus Planktophila sp.]|jgi:exopolyphosphatase/guanosine-5'-triphosphate,3'-diphosphate pyrophosphatase|nr:Ppx/GppA family phosphatase [Candidatus Planktophila sp.]